MNVPQAGRPWRPPSAPGAGIDVWRAELGAGPHGVEPVEDEQERAARMRDEVGRARFLASRAWLRAILAGYLSVDAAAIRFSRADRGKPVVVDGADVHFSLSRSADMALIAVTRGRVVGVDVERVRSDVDHEALAARFFAEAEVADLRELPELARRDAFFHLWVRKEAVLKATGAGLGDGMDHVDLRLDTVADGWSVTSLDVGPGWAGAVAVEGPPGRIWMADVAG